LFKDDLQISRATGFFYRVLFNDVPSVFLVTNWHVLSGRNSQDPRRTLHSEGAVPNRIVVRLLLDQPARPDGAGALVLQRQDKMISLYDADGAANWAQHPVMKNEADIGVLNLGTQLSGFRIFCANEIANAYDMAITIGADVFILGYPLGFAHFIGTPIWKRGSIASEPHVEAPGIKGRIVIDATTRKGMSGAPVVMRAATHYLTQTGEVKCAPNAYRIIGVYASRPIVQAMDVDVDERNEIGPSAEIGYVYKSGLIEEVIKGLSRGPNYGVLP
jgi:hypothetical protein